MKKIVLFLPLLLASCLQQPDRNCTAFTTGTFRFEHEIDGVKKVSFFKRTKTLQIETYEGKTDTASIRWVNDCEFVLEKLHPKSYRERQAIGMKILTTSKNSYTFEFGIVGSEETQIGTATKIN